jgi:hypothetical protein
MRNKIKTVAIVLAAFSFLLIQSCKEDTSPPKITIIGSLDTTIAKNTIYIDPGATAEDDKDESVYVITNFSASNPDETITGDYTILYKAQDRNANSTSATRIVSVTRTGPSVAYTYSVTDTSQFDTLYYSSDVTANIINPFQIYISNLAQSTSFSGDAYANLKGNTIIIPSQRPDGPFSQYIVSGTGTISEITPNIIWDLHYMILDTTNLSYSEPRHAAFIF